MFVSYEFEFRNRIKSLRMRIGIRYTSVDVICIQIWICLSKLSIGVITQPLFYKLGFWNRWLRLYRLVSTTGQWYVSKSSTLVRVRLLSPFCIKARKLFGLFKHAWMRRCKLPISTLSKPITAGYYILSPLN